MTGDPGIGRILVVYASKHGHTAKVAERLAEAARADGADVVVRDVASAADADLADFEVVVVGGSIHAGHHQRDLVDWAAARAAALAAMPSACFTVCLTVADDTDESHDATRRYHDEFVAATGWSPAVAATFAGALQYREYDHATRLLMRLLMRRGGHPTDTSRDYDYTDWAAVERFGRECARWAAAARPPA
jgi:menaquinone-dependent protoporphyrinogen oxidase